MATKAVSVAELLCFNSLLKSIFEFIQTFCISKNSLLPGQNIARKMCIWQCWPYIKLLMIKKTYTEKHLCSGGFAFSCSYTVWHRTEGERKHWSHFVRFLTDSLPMLDCKFLLCLHLEYDCKYNDPNLYSFGLPVQTTVMNKVTRENGFVNSIN